MISRVKQQLRGSDLHNSAANTPRGRLTFAASKLGLPSANPRPHRLTSRFAPPRNGPGSLLFPPALKVIPRRLPPHDLSLRYHPTPRMARTTLLKGGKCRLLGGELISLHPPRISSKRFHEIVSNPFVLFHCSLLVVSFVHLRKKGEITVIIADINSRPIPSILYYIYITCAPLALI